MLRDSAALSVVCFLEMEKEESGEEKGAQRKRCMRNCLIWGAILFLYLAAAFLCLVPVVQDLVPAFLPDPGAVSGWIRRPPFVVSFIVRLVTAPALFLLPGIGMFLGLRR